MKRFIVLVPVALAACNSSPTVTAKNASMAEVSNKVAEAAASGQFVSPGRWEATMKISDITMPGAPAGMAEKMKERMPTKAMVSCLTPEEAKAPKGNFFGGQRDCTYDHFTMANGQLDAKMVCKAGGQDRTMVMKGSYSPDTYQMTVESTGSGQKGPMAGMSIKMTMDAKRTGECTGDENK